MTDFESLNIDIGGYDDMGSASKIAEAGVTSATDDTAAVSSGGDINGVREGSPPSADLDKDEEVEGKLFIGGVSWQTTEEGLR